MPLRDLFKVAVMDYNRAVFNNERQNRVLCQDIFEVDPSGYELVYLDPPYAPPRDDSDYMKRYHFLEGLSVYWRGQTIMEHTLTKKIEKRFTPFAYKRTVREAFRELFFLFRRSTIVLSYSSNSVPDEKEIQELESWRHPVTGAAIVERAYRREEIYSGECLEEAPDVINDLRAGACQINGLGEPARQFVQWNRHGRHVLLLSRV